MRGQRDVLRLHAGVPAGRKEPVADSNQPLAALAPPQSLLRAEPVLPLRLLPLTVPLLLPVPRPALLLLQRLASDVTQR